MRWATADCTGDTVQGYRVGWVNANSKAIQAIGTHVITHNDRVSGSKEPMFEVDDNYYKTRRRRHLVSIIKI